MISKLCKRAAIAAVVCILVLIPAKSRVYAVTDFEVSINVPDSGETILSWDKQSSVSKYYIYRAVNKDLNVGKLKKIAEVSGTKRTYSDSTVKANTDYTYVVKAYKVTGKKKKLISTATQTVYVGVLSVSSYPGDDMQWNVGTTLQGYFESYGDMQPAGMEIYRKEDKGSYKKIITINSFREDADGYIAGFLDMGINAGTTYKYKARVYWIEGGEKKYSTFSKARSVTAVNTEPVIHTRLQSEDAEHVSQLVVCVENAAWNNGKIYIRTNGYSDIDGETFDGYLTGNDDESDFSNIYVTLKEYSYDNKNWKKYEAGKAIVLKHNKSVYLKFESADNVQLDTSGGAFYFMADYESSFSKRLYEIGHCYEVKDNIVGEKTVLQNTDEGW